MGCGASGLSSAASSVLGGTKAIPTPTEDGVGHGRSIILSRAARAVMPEVVRSIRAADGSLELRPGAHFLIGRWRHGAWDPAAGATPPLAIANTQHTYVPSGKRQMLRLSYGLFSSQGHIGEPDAPYTNQDNLVVVEGIGNVARRCLFAVFDGHGPSGNQASAFARDLLPDVLVNDRRFRDQPVAAMAAAFPKLHRKYLAASSQLGNRVMDSQVSGTTGLALLVDGDTLVCANCGDCRAIICSKDERSAGGVVARPLSVDHKPSRPDERARILNSPLAMVCSLSQVVPGESGAQLFVCRPAASRRPPRGARMGRKPSAPQLSDAAKADADAGGDPSTIGLQGFGGTGRSAPFAGTQPSAGGPQDEEGDDVAIQYAVMFTRSMGDADAHANLGVIAEPEVRASRLRPGKELFFVLATDGVWDTMSNEQVADCVSHSTGPQAAAEAVTAQARWAWSMRSGERKDDITCVVVWLRWMDESEARRESRLPAVER
ncbi:hypothetical protein FNF28_05631 [Cafeteria roenbergensis]|uniref:PPM-type phosphatase domain-containing protein n=1 Tax=Cafeteria roenbergensis TaxID=33653 RepID=A0A5A8D387_CAFRO|nr:hypothetical protein FNF28_05631 [Cafeteria roenbergensis]